MFSPYANIFADPAACQPVRLGGGLEPQQPDGGSDSCRGHFASWKITPTVWR